MRLDNLYISLELKCKFYLLIFSLIFLMSCSSDEQDLQLENLLDYASVHWEKEILFEIESGHSISGWLTKPEGSSMDLIIGLHGGTPTLEKSLAAAKSLASKDDGGQLFGSDKAFLSLGYTEFETDGSMADRGFKELSEVLSIIDQINRGFFADSGFDYERLYTFGISRGGGLALLAAIERNIDGAISAEGPLDWLATRQAIEAGRLAPNFLELAGFEESTAAWGDPIVDPAHWITYSPGLRIEEFQAPALIISGYDDRVILIETALDMQARYQDCASCQPGFGFILHPNGHTDWATVSVQTQIEIFVDSL